MNWISVEDALPVREMECLVVRKGEVTGAATYQPGEGWNPPLYDESSRFVTHWVPWPKPPAESLPRYAFQVNAIAIRAAGRIDPGDAVVFNPLTGCVKAQTREGRER